MGKKLLLIVSLFLVSILTFGQQIFEIYSDNNFMGLKDNKGKIFVPANRYNKIIPMKRYRLNCSKNSYLCDSLFLVVENNFKGIINYQGEMILKPEYENIFIDTCKSMDTYIIVTKNKKQGLCTIDGRFVVPANKYNKITSMKRYGSNHSKNSYLCNSLFLVEENNFKGIINYQGEMILKPEYENIFIDTCKSMDTYIIVTKNKKQGLCTIDGRFIVPIIFNSVSVADSYTYAPVPYIEVSNKVKDAWFYGVFDFNGHEIVPSDRYDKVKQECYIINNTQYFYYKTKAGDKEGLYDLLGNMLFPAAEFPWANLDVDKRSSNGFVIRAYSDPNPTPNSRCVIYELYTNKVLQDNKNDYERFKIIEKGDIYFENSSYKLAAKEYSKALELIKQDYLLYNRALCYYNLSKYNDAIKDFNECLKITKRSDLKNKSQEMINLSYENKEQKKQRRSWLALAIIGTVLKTYNDVTMFKRNNDAIRYNYRSVGTGSTGVYSGEYSSSGSGYSSNSTGQSSSSRCGVCGGAGTIVEYTSSYGISTRKYCSDCGKDVTGNHYHKTCPLCHGKG